MNKITTNIIIPNYNGLPYLEPCLRSINDSKLKKNQETRVTVVDDASIDASQAWLKNYKKSHPTLNLILLSKNRGTSFARNTAAVKARGKYLLFLDVDTKLDKNSLKELMQLMEKKTDLGAAQARLDTSGHFLSFFGLPYEISMPTQEIFAGRTAGLMVRRSVFEKIGGFDDDYLIYGEDTDLCWRIWLAGYRVELALKAIIFHQGKSSLNQKTWLRILSEGAKNSVSNLVKNASLEKLWWMLPLLFLTWMVIAAKKLFTGKLKAFFAIFWGWVWNLIHLRKTYQKRKNIVRAKNNRAEEIMFGQLGLRQLFAKSIRWFYAV